MTRRTLTPYTVGIAQISVKLGDLEAKLAKHLEYIERAKETGVSLLIFPELSLTGYYLHDIPNQIGMSISSPQPPLQKLLEASRHNDMDICVGFVEEDDRFVHYIAQAYIGQGEIKHVHRKVYLPT